MRKNARKLSKIIITGIITVTTVLFVPKINIAIETYPVKATETVAYQKMSVVDHYLRIDQITIDLAQKPALIVVEAPNAPDLVNIYRQIPGSKRPVLIYVSQSNVEPDYLQGLDYFLCRQGNEINGSSLIFFSPTKGLQGFLYNAVIDQLHQWEYPKLIGKGQVFNSTEDPSGNNSYRASLQLNHTIIQPGGEFRFYDYVEPSEAAGYQTGMSIFSDGAGGYIWGPDLGGGICKTATVLHYAVMDAGLQETERSNHSLQVTYAMPGDDAAVSRSGGANYCFVNNRANPVMLVFQQQEGKLYAAIYEIIKVDSAAADIDALLATDPLAFGVDPIFIPRAPAAAPSPVSDATLVSGPTLQTNPTESTMAQTSNNTEAISTLTTETGEPLPSASTTTPEKVTNQETNTTTPSVHMTQGKQN